VFFFAAIFPSSGQLLIFFFIFFLFAHLNLCTHLRPPPCTFHFPLFWPIPRLDYFSIGSRVFASLDFPWSITSLNHSISQPRGEIAFPWILSAGKELGKVQNAGKCDQLWPSYGML